MSFQLYLPRDSAIQVNLIALAARSIHLMVRIQDSQSWHRGSIPLSTTTQELPFSREFFYSLKLSFVWCFPKYDNWRFNGINEVINIQLIIKTVHLSHHWTNQRWDKWILFELKHWKMKLVQFYFDRNYGFSIENPLFRSGFVNI